MSLAFYASTIINVSLLIILCIGFTFTYMMEKFPNFAHTGYSAIGTVTTFYLVRFYNFNPYATWPISAFVGGIVGVLLYLVIVRPIKYRGNREITLTFTFYIISVMISSFLAIFSFWILMNTRVRAAGFIVRSHDFRIWGIQGIGVVAPTVVIFLVMVFYWFLNYNKYGIAMRATAEDETLASSLGVNIDRIHIFSWFISGALSGLAGAIIPLWIGTSVNFSDTLLISVMAGSVLGGLNSIPGAVIGGIIVGTSQKALSMFLIKLMGVHVGIWEPLLPMILLFVILAIEPNGVTALRGKELSVLALRNSIRNFRKAIWNLLTTE